MFLDNIRYLPYLDNIRYLDKIRYLSLVQCHFPNQNTDPDIWVPGDIYCFSTISQGNLVFYLHGDQYHHAHYEGEHIGTYSLLVNAKYRLILYSVLIKFIFSWTEF